MKVKVSQSCPTLCDPMDYTVHGILQARIPEWVAFPFSRGSSQPRTEPGLPLCRRILYTSWATTEAWGRMHVSTLGSLMRWSTCWPPYNNPPQTLYRLCSPPWRHRPKKSNWTDEPWLIHERASGRGTEMEGKKSKTNLGKTSFF